jgi:hypothetical protein
LALENFAFFCVKFFALESVVVVSGASQFEDFLEATAATQNHGTLSSAFHSSTMNLGSVKMFRHAATAPVKVQQNRVRYFLSQPQNLIFAVLDQAKLLCKDFSRKRI